MKIVLTGGGTAGHVTPNIALLEKLSNHNVYYLGTNGMEKRLIQPLVEQGALQGYYSFTAHKLVRKLTLQNFMLPFQLAKSVKQCKRILQKIKPDVIFSKGGFVGLPVVIAGKKLGIKTVVHESDVTPGLANKISFLFADVKLSAFPCKKCQTVGAILREEKGDRQKGLKTMGFDGKKPVLLVMGGSLGAGTLNTAVENTAEKLCQTFDVFVITGKSKSINNAKIHQAEYVTNIFDLYASAGVCVTRAGANSLAELTKNHLPFVAVPLKKHSRGEQQKNAEFFAKQGVGIVLNEDNIDSLAEVVTKVYNNKASFCIKAQKLQFDGTDKVVEILTRK